MDLDDRLVHHPEDNVLYVNLEGLHLDTAEQARNLATYLDRRLTTLGRVHAVSTTTTSNSGRCRGHLFTMIRDSTEKHFLSATHYSTNAFFRHQLGPRFPEAQLGQSIYPTFAAAREGTRE